MEKHKNTWSWSKNWHVKNFEKSQLLIPQRILFATDFSQTSYEVVTDLAVLLRELPSVNTLLLLNTYLISAAAPSELILQHDRLRQESQEKLAAQKTALQNLVGNPKISFEIISCMGRWQHVINHLVKEQNLDCVVMGIHDLVRSHIQYITCPTFMLKAKKEMAVS